MLKVAIVDDSPEVQASLSRLFAQNPAIEVVGLAADVVGAKAMIERCCPDIVVLDVELGNNDTSMPVLRFLREHRPSTHVIMLSNSTWGSLRAGFLAAGAEAYFDKATEFLQARDWIASLVE
jgi:two-component system chemotaxis response regulator CheB